MRVALVHDDLVQWGGAERVLIALSELFPTAPIYTSVYDSNHPILSKCFSSKRIISSFIQKIPGWENLYRQLLPLYPIAFEQFNFDEYDLVISQSTRFAKVILTKPKTVHISYCHTPPRFLWNFSEESVSCYLKPYFSWLRLYDRISSERVDFWIAGSKNSQSRIKQIYKKDSMVIYPFVDFKRFEDLTSFDGDYFLVISRLNKYKRVDLIVDAANQLKLPVKIVGTGPEFKFLESIAGSNVEMLKGVDEETLGFLLSGCKALITAAEDDFGLTALEAQALGKPVIAYKKGGSLETVIDGQTGYFFDLPTKEGVITALARLEKYGYNKSACIKNARRFSKEKFIKAFNETVRFLLKNNAL